MHQRTSEQVPTSRTKLLQEWGWHESADTPKAAYIHVPFCRHRCGYCNFSLLANRDDLFDRFLDSLKYELEGLQTPRRVETIFIGGGTPSILHENQMEQLLSLISKWLPLVPSGEWSIECNPLDVRESLCLLWRSYGVNRISLGGQSFQSNKLKILERDHSPEQLVQALSKAQEHFERVSLDLIFAAPNETLAEWVSDLDWVRRIAVRHVSTYGLTYEKGAKFWGRRQRSQLKPTEESLELEMYSYAVEYLPSIGLEHYEVSNFAATHHRCRHNQSYWQGSSWWAFGPSAARFVGGVRSVNHRGTLEYIRRLEQERSPVVESENLTDEQLVREFFVFGMRQMAGVLWADILVKASKAVSDSILASVQHHVHNGWMEWREDRVRLTQKGLFVSDSLWEAYL
jgi:oxygen-independent coproporphyrinogen III oxidase